MGPEFKHKRLATEEVRKPASNSKKSTKLKTEQSLTKYGSSKYINIGGSGNSTLSKAEMLLLEIKPN